MGSPSPLEIFVKLLSWLLGWIYMLCWSLSFYPQPINNFRRRSTYGLAIDFPTINVLGFVCYTVYAAVFLYSPLIQEQYAARNPHSPKPSVRFNDLAFAVHAVILSTLVYTQFYPSIWGFKVAKYQRVSKPIAGLFWGSLIAIALLAWIVVTKSPDGGSDPYSWAWIDLLYGISYVKVVVTVVKYVPQAWLNYKRKSTVGWDIRQIILDLSGGVLSIGQLILDSSFDADWSAVTGNPIKFLLGNVSIIFDVLFVVQHYILYKDRTDKESDDINNVPNLRTPLLSEDGGLPQ
ncbi:putative L-cystine transporter [Talaromyces proteolyticus]|uniref:L-cystine transporter n=1 Tax=Talaromyces proteolyticus TaxID=1131652 RepID=A0AAD4KWU0_9EURO|nr:putative L-cystine transporter [Talaromyces proteolyticus]KAH8700652.1 putative L-cystine transporter [Talaromyces proteolyticus]